MGDAAECPAGKFLCQTNSGYDCISNEWKCDFQEDCIDGADENGCEKCNPSLFGCKSKAPPHDWKCIDLRWRCDGSTECAFAEDEIACEYRPKGLQALAPDKPKRRSTTTTTTTHRSTGTKTRVTRSTTVTSSNKLTAPLVRTSSTTTATNIAPVSDVQPHAASRGDSRIPSLLQSNAGHTVENRIHTESHTVTTKSQAQVDLLDQVDSAIPSSLVIIISLGVIVLIVILLIVWCCRRSRKRRRNGELTSPDLIIPCLQEQTPSFDSSVMVTSIRPSENIYDVIDDGLPTHNTAMQKSGNPNVPCIPEATQTETTNGAYAEIVSQPTASSSRDPAYETVRFFGKPAPGPVSIYEKPLLGRKQNARAEIEYMSIGDVLGAFSSNAGAAYEEPVSRKNDPSIVNEGGADYDRRHRRLYTRDTGQGLNNGSVGHVPKNDVSNYLRPVDNPYINPV